MFTRFPSFLLWTMDIPNEHSESIIHQGVGVLSQINNILLRIADIMKEYNLS